MTSDLIAVDPRCWRAAKLAEHTIRHFSRMADQRTADGLLIFNPAHAFCLDYPDLFAGCTTPVPTEAAVAAVKAMEPKPAPKREGFPAFNGYDGSKRWAELHTELSPSPETVARVLSRTCLACQPHSRALVTKIPPDLTTLDAYRRWTCILHNAVSASIGSATLTYEQAASRWGW